MLPIHLRVPFLTVVSPILAPNRGDIMAHRRKTYQQQCSKYWQEWEHGEYEGVDKRKLRRFYDGKLTLDVNEFFKTPMDNVFSVMDKVHETPKAHVTICTTPKSGTTVRSIIFVRLLILIMFGQITAMEPHF